MKTYCCDVMERFANQGGCVPCLHNGIITGCDDAFDELEGGQEINFCPWCGAKLEVGTAFPTSEAK